MNRTPSAGAAGFGPSRIGLATPSRARRPAASTTRGSPPSGKTMRLSSPRAREVRLERNASAGSETANRSVTQKFPERPQALHVVAYRFEGRGQGNREQEPGGVPQESPEHERDGNHQRVQVHPRTHDFGIEQVERDQVQHRDDEEHDQKPRELNAASDGHQSRRYERERQADIRDQAQEAAGWSG